MGRVVIGLAAALMAVGFALGIVGVLALANTDSPALRAADGALLFVDLLALTALSFLIWPGRA